MKRVLMATGIYPPEIGGAASAVADLAHDLSQTGISVQVVAYGGTETVTERQENVTVTRISRQGSVLARYWRYARMVRQLIDDTTIVCVTDISSAGLPTWLATIGRKNTIIYRLGGERAWEQAIAHKRVTCSLKEYWEKRRGGVRQWLMCWQYRLVLAHPTQVIVVSALLKECLLRIQPVWESKIVVVPTRLATLMQPITPHERQGSLKLVFVGRCTAVKNLSFLLRVLRRLQSDGVAYTCQIVGDGEEKTRLQQEAHDLPGVAFIERQSREQVSTILKEADALLLPSLTDIYPQVVLEALSVGTPVILTREHGLEAGFGGILYASPIDEEAWVQAIYALLDPSAYQMLRAQIHIPPRHMASWTERILSLC